MYVNTSIFTLEESDHENSTIIIPGYGKSDTNEISISFILSIIMRRLVSISPIEKKFETSGSRPILVFANDFEHYVCKYPHFPNDSKLVNEYLGNRFAQIWEISVPEMAFVQIKRQHIPEQMLGNNLNYFNLEKPLVGFKLIPDVTEVMDRLSEGISSSDLSKYRKKDLLRIALFDVWLSNDDRNTNNTNILIKRESNKIIPVAIDHEKIFNTSTLDRKIHIQTYEDSIFYSSLYHRLFKKSESTVNLIHEVCATLHERARGCNTQLDGILDDIPDEWNIDIEELKEKLGKNIFQESWLNKVEATFRNFASLAIKNP